MPDSQHPAVAIVGPTASGKSELGLELARALDGEIVNYDSIQLYRLFDIGTAKPSLLERATVPHHMVDVLDPGELFSAGDYRSEAEPVLAGIRRRGRVPILVGGTGLYLRALIEGLFEGPRRSEYWRERLRDVAEGRGREYVHSILARLDPETARRIAAADLPKVVRAIEVHLATGRPLSSHLAERPRAPIAGFSFSIVGLSPGREQLHERIHLRVARMYEEGLVEEVRRILEGGIPRDAAAFRAIGYRQALQYIDGIIPIGEAIMLTERDTRRYAKRQMTWFRRQHSAKWFEGFGSDPAIRERIIEGISKTIDSVSAD